MLLAGMVTGYMFYEQGRRNLPNNAVHKVGRMAAVTLMQSNALFRYPNRLETDRLIMYYDAPVSEPIADAVAMDAHLARLEEILGKQQHSKIHWVRGKALGMRTMSIHSIALGSAASPATALDRHELAHSFLYQFSQPDSEPPMLLLEGWAMAVDGHDEPLALTALASRTQLAIWRPGDSCLRSILGADLYHVGSPFTYEVGGAFVDFLLRRHGADKFLEFYNAIHPEDIDSPCQRIFHCDFDELESAFWADAERNAPKEKAVKRLAAWAAMLDRQSTPQTMDRDRRVAALLRAVTPEEGLAILRGKRLERLPALAKTVGLTVAECERELANVTWQLTKGLGEPPP